MAVAAALPRYRHIADSLREEIRAGALAPGMRVPSYRALMETHSVTMATVRQAISSLQVEGIIQSVPGVGCIVSDAPAKWISIGVPVLGYGATGYLFDELSLVHEELAAERCDLVLRFVPVVDEASLANLALWAQRRDGVMITGRISVRVIQTLAATGVPAVVLGEPLDGECPADVSFISADVPGKVQTALTRLIGMGHRRIGLVSGSATRYYEMVSRCFQEAARTLGLAEGIAGLPELLLPRDRECRAEAVRRWYLGLVERPTALLVEGSTVASAIIEHFARRGLRVPEDLSVAAISGGERPPRIIEGLARVEGRIHVMLQRGARVLAGNAGAARRTVVREQLPAQWIPGTTCREVAS